MGKVSKSKIIMSITIGLMSFMMIYVMLIQFNIVKENTTKEVEFMRETELKETLTSYKEKYEDTMKEIEDTQAKIDEYKHDEKSEEDAVKLLEEEVKKSNMLLGNTDVVGEGIIIRIENNIRYDEQESSIISTSDLIDLVNELKLAGAEAISINGERIVSKSDIFNVGNFVCINGQRTTPPYEIRAIGDKTYLESALRIKGGYIDAQRSNGFVIDLEVKDQGIFIGKYQGEMTLKYVKK